MIDSLHYGLQKIQNRDKFLNQDYGLVTLHRPSNVDDINKLKEILETLSTISNQISLYFSVHPRTKSIIEDNKITLNENIKMLDALSYLDFLHLILIKTFCQILILIYLTILFSETPVFSMFWMPFQGEVSRLQLSPKLSYFSGPFKFFSGFIFE